MVSHSWFELLMCIAALEIHLPTLSSAHVMMCDSNVWWEEYNLSTQLLRYYN